MRVSHLSTLAALGFSLWLLLPNASAQITNVVFSDDFSKNGIDTSKYAIDSPFFEGGVGDIKPKVENGVLEITGTVSQQWWAGATLRVLPTFQASTETNIVISVDRMVENGQGTASRSALWIMDSTMTKYVLFADVRAEGGWRYNRKIGISGDVPTGSGTDIAAFNGGTFDDSGEHKMKVVSNGKTVKLYLDEIFGAEVAFPYDKLVFQLGSYARANNDTADTIFDNLKIETVGTATFSQSSLTLGTGQTTTNLAVRIPPGANASKAVTITISNNSPARVTYVGGTGNTLKLTFPAGGSNVQSFGIQALALGGAKLSMTSDANLIIANSMDVTVVKGPGVVLEETFSSSTLDTTKWQVTKTGFENTGIGNYETSIKNGAFHISGFTDTAYWAGATIKTVGDFTASTNLPLVFEMDRVGIDPLAGDGVTQSTGARTGVYITSYDAVGNRDPFVYFGQNIGETGWQVNVQPGSPTGSGTALAPFASLASDTNAHKMKMVADGKSVEVFLDGVSGGKFDLALGVFLQFEIGAFARDASDAVHGVFDNIKISNVLPDIKMAPADVFAIQGDNANVITVSIPTLMNSANDAKVTISSSDPTVAIPEGAVDGKLTLTFAAGKSSTQTFKVITLSPGLATLTLSNDQSVGVANTVNVTVTSLPKTMFSDDFAGATVDSSKWTTDNTPLVSTGVMVADASSLFITNGMLAMIVTAEASDWPGYTMWTKSSYAATEKSPVVFEIDRYKMEYVLVGGTSAKQRTGIWIKNASTNFIFFSDFGSWDGTTGGWQYHLNALGDLNTSGNYLTAFNAAQYTDQKNHKMKMVLNGKTVKLYIDNVLGAEVAFPYAKDLTFGFGSYVNFGNSGQNIVRGFFDNPTVLGYPPSTAPNPVSIARQADGKIVISWTGAGVLQSSAKLPGNWSDVTPAPTGTTYTVTPGASAQFFRLRN